VSYEFSPESVNTSYDYVSISETVTKKVMTTYTPSELNEFIVSSYRASTHPSLLSVQRVSLLKDLLNFLGGIAGGTYKESWESSIRDRIKQEKERATTQIAQTYTNESKENM